MQPIELCNRVLFAQLYMYCNEELVCYAASKMQTMWKKAGKVFYLQL